MKRLVTSLAAAALLGTGVLAISAGPASAYVVCNSNGDCWHTDHRYRYGRDLGTRYHNDDWYFHQRWDQDHERHWRDYHDGRGGYRNGIWFNF